MADSWNSPWMGMARASKRLVQTALAKFGYQIVRAHIPKTSHGLDCLFPVLKHLGFAPQHVLDVGANKGIWTRGALKYFPDASYTLVEPQEELKAHIEDLVSEGYKIHWIHAGASDKRGVLPFTIRERDDSSNFTMPEAEARAAGFRCVPMEVRTLDEIVAASNLPVPEMVKIDAEGFDLKVLAGASTLVGKTEIFFLEADVRGSGENSVLRVVERMWDCGYSLLDVTDINRSPKFGILWLLELAFIRNGSGLLARVDSYE